MTKLATIHQAEFDPSTEALMLRLDDGTEHRLRVPKNGAEDFLALLRIALYEQEMIEGQATNRAFPIERIQFAIAGMPYHLVLEVTLPGGKPMRFSARVRSQEETTLKSQFARLEQALWDVLYEGEPQRPT